MSIVSYKKFAIADAACDSIKPMPKVTIPDLIGKRVDSSVPKAQRMTYEEIASSSGGRISSSHVNDLRNGKKDPRKLTAEKIVGLAKGLGEHPTVVFEAAVGDLYTGLKDASVAQVVTDFLELPAKERGDAEFAFRLLKEKVDQAKLRRSNRNT